MTKTLLPVVTVNTIFQLDANALVDREEGIFSFDSFLALLRLEQPAMVAKIEEIALSIARAGDQTSATHMMAGAVMVYKLLRFQAEWDSKAE